VASAPDTEPTPKLGGNTRRLGGLVLILAAVLVILVVFSHRGLYQVCQLREEKLRVDQENARLTEENTRLARTIKRLQDDPVMIQDLIRRELNFVRKNEIILQLPSPDKGRAEPSDGPENPSPVLKTKQKGQPEAGQKPQGARQPRKSPQNPLP